MREDALTEAKTSLSFFARARLLLKDARAEMKANGMRGLIRRYGWKLFAFVFAYYLVRDVTLYIVLPWLIARRLISG